MPAAVKDKVVIHGLTKAAEFNGKEGSIVGYDEKSGRFEVRLNGGGRKIMVKPANLESRASGSGSSSVTDKEAEQMRNAFNNTSPAELLSKAQHFKNMTHEQMNQMRRQNAQLRNMSDEQIRAMGDQMEKMSKNPEMMKKMMQQMKDMTPEQMQYQADLMKSMSPDQLKNIEKLQQQMSNDPNADPTALSQDLMKNMTPEQMSDMMKMQKSMLKGNPEMVKKMMATNPMMRNMTPEQLEQQLDMMADMDPKNLERLMNVSQFVQKNLAPLVKFYQVLNKATGGRANAIILVSIAVGFYYFIDWLFFAGARQVAQMPVEPLGSETVDPLDAFDDEL